MRLFAGETKQDRKQRYLQEIKYLKDTLAFFRQLYIKYPYNRIAITNIMGYLSKEIKQTIKDLMELGRLK